MLWAVAEMSWVWPEAFDSLCMSSGSEGPGLQRARPREHAVGHGRDEQGSARGLRLAVRSSGSEGPGLQRARPREHAVGHGRRGFKAQEVANMLWAVAEIAGSGPRPSTRCAEQRQRRCRTSTRKTSQTRCGPWPRRAGFCPRSSTRFSAGSFGRTASRGRWATEQHQESDNSTLCGWALHLHAI